MALDMADTILLVAQLELSSLRNVVRMLLTLNVQEGLAEKVRVVVNRVGSDCVEREISLKRAEETVGKPIFWQVPNDAKPVFGSRVEGQPLVVHAPKCRAQLSIQGLAQAITNRAAAAAAEAANGTSGRFFRGIFGGKK
jgi:pilus assembly protein CpaE